MKKVRFESPCKSHPLNMNDSECHSPRPYIERKIEPKAPKLCKEHSEVLNFSNDPIQRFECSNTLPYPEVQKVVMPNISELKSKWQPSNELELSMLDVSYHEPRKPLLPKSLSHQVLPTVTFTPYSQNRHQEVFCNLSNEISTPPNVLIKDNSFFLKKDGIDKNLFNCNSPLPHKFNRLSLGKENNPEVLQSKCSKDTKNNTEGLVMEVQHNKPSGIPNTYNCYHCSQPQRGTVTVQALNDAQNPFQFKPFINDGFNCLKPCHPQCAQCHNEIQIKQVARKPDTAMQKIVDKKTWALERFVQNSPDCKEIEKQTNVSKENIEPTVADLFKIIKLQNEQLQLLQEKVDKFILQSTESKNEKQIQQHSNNVDRIPTVEQNKISVGVMTSFEMVRTSTFINKQVRTQKNVQVQCNQSQISIKEVSKPVNTNFLEGITHVCRSSKPVDCKKKEDRMIELCETQTVHEEKTLNEHSLFNIQVDNLTTPLLSPEQSMYLDVRDYSDSESDIEDESNIGWTYYNKVMTHVNGVLQGSDMPSSASAMFRNAKQECVEMHIDRTNFSVLKRVKFGDDPVVQNPLPALPTSDTSLKMNQLAAKYLKSAPTLPSPPPVQRPPLLPVDMSFATRNYMEQYNLLPDAASNRQQLPSGYPKFLDITALKQQTKLL